MAARRAASAIAHFPMIAEGSLDLGDDLIGVAGLEGLGDAVDQEVEVFHDDGPDQGVRAPRLDDAR